MLAFHLSKQCIGYSSSKLYSHTSAEAAVATSSTMGGVGMFVFDCWSSFGFFVVCKRMDLNNFFVFLPCHLMEFLMCAKANVKYNQMEMDHCHTPVV